MTTRPSTGSMSIVRQRRAFLPGLMLILTVVYGTRSFTWWTTETTGRAAGIEWVSSWMNADLVAALWAVSALACLLAAVLLLAHTREGLALWSGMLGALIPAVIGLFFVLSTLIWLVNGSPEPGSGPGNSWLYRGSASGYVTGVEYIAWSLVVVWGLMVHTGLAQILANQAARRWGRSRGDGDR